MERFTNNIRLLWRAERILAEHEIRFGTQKLAIQALAGLVGVFGLGMLGVGLFFAIEPHWGRSLAAITVTGIDLIVAGILFSIAAAKKPAREVAMVREMRDTALIGIKDEAGRAEAEVSAVRDDIHNFVRNPLGSMFPFIANPMLGAVSRGLKGMKKKP